MADKRTLDLARQWARRVGVNHPHISPDKKAAADVIASLPDTVVDGDKVREMIETYEHARDGNAKGSEGWMINHLMVSNLESLLPAPAPTVNIALGAWAMHPEHGKVMIVSGRPDSYGYVSVLWEDWQFPDGVRGTGVQISSLSPLEEA